VIDGRVVPFLWYIFMNSYAENDLSDFFVFDSIPIFGEKSQWRVPDWNIELSVCR
jgi:hypothetical protein